MTMRLSMLRPLALVVAGGLALSACSQDAAPAEADAADGTTAADETDGGTYAIPQQSGVPPWAFTDAGDNLIGLSPELTLGLAPHLAVTIENERNSWENALLGLESEKYVFVPGAGITDERLRTFDFAVAMRDGYGFKVKAGNAEIPDDMSGLCGLSIGLPAGASVIPALEEQSDACTQAGEDPLDLKTFPDWASADLAAQSGQIDAATATISSMNWQARENPDAWTVTGPEYAFQEIGFAVLKGSDWGPRLVDAFNGMIEDGSYAEIFDGLDLASMMVDESRLVTE